MSTTQQTTGSNTSNLQFNPGAQSQYNSLISGANNVLSQYMNNPLSGTMFNMGAAQSQRGALNNGQSIMQAMTGGQNPGQAGNAGQGFLQAQKAGAGRAASNQQSQGNISNIMAGLGRQTSAIGTGLSFSPQLTGQTGSFSQMGSQGGLGSWLTPLISGIGASVADYFKGGGGGGGG
jgi:hypothetical protein